MTTSAAAPGTTTVSPSAPLGVFGAAILGGWFGLLLVGLNLVHDSSVHDKTLLPRLHALLVMLGGGLVPLAVPRVARRVDASVLREPVCLAASAAVGVTAVSLAFAQNPSAGLLDLVRTLATCLVLGVSCLFLPLLTDWKGHLLRLLVLSVTVTAGLGWYELITVHGFGIHDRRWIEDVTGRMGNVNLLSGYLVFVLPMCLAAGCVLRGFWRMAAWAAVAGALVLVILLQSRAAFVGLFLSLFAGLVGGWLWRRQLGLGRRAWGILLASVAVGLAGVGGFALVAGPDHPLVARVRSIALEPAEAAAPRAGGRLLVWRLTATMIGDHPLTGVGAGNFPVRIQEYYGTPGIDLSVLQTDNWLRPHNDLLQVWAEKGIVGLVAFLALFAAAFAAVVVTARRATDRRDAWLALAIGMSVVAYLACSGFDFPLERISHQVTLAVLLAAATVLRRGAVPLTRPASGSALLPRLVVPVVAVGLGLGLAWTTIALRQERDAVAARQALDDHDWDAAAALARRATTPWRTLDPLGTPVAFLEGYARMQQGDLAAATACLERARRHNPNRLFVLNNLGILYATAGKYDAAIECFTLAAAHYPHQPEGVTNLAGCYLDAGQPAATVALLERVSPEKRTPAMEAHLARARELLEPAAAVPGP